MLHDLPILDEKRLFDIVNRGVKPQGEKPDDSGRGGSRHLTLNDYLCPKVWLYFPHDWNGFLAEARAWNESSARERIGKERLDDQGVMRMVLAVWHDCEKGKLRRMQGGRGVFRGTRDEMTTLFAADSAHGPDALALLLTFRLEHSARCEQGETFAICPFSMARDQVIPGWSRKRYEKARDLLLEARLITCVSEYVRGWKTGRSARYLIS